METVEKSKSKSDFSTVSTALGNPAKVRWDMASSPVFGPIGSSNLQSHQWTFALDILLKF
jgi:hypothetical protein